MCWHVEKKESFTFRAIPITFPESRSCIIQPEWENEIVLKFLFVFLPFKKKKEKRLCSYYLPIIQQKEDLEINDELETHDFKLLKNWNKQCQIYRRCQQASLESDFWCRKSSVWVYLRKEWFPLSASHKVQQKKTSLCKILAKINDNAYHIYLHF